MHKNKHVFSVYLENLSDLVSGFQVDKKIEILSRPLHQRLTKVLKLKACEQVVLFDKKINIKMSLDHKTLEHGKMIYGTLLQIKENEQLVPEIIFAPCLLKRTSFESVIYTAAQMGANVIRPVLTEKVHKPSPRLTTTPRLRRTGRLTGNKWKEKEVERLEKIMISACEQSKNYCLPQLEQPVLLQDFLKDLDLNIKKVFFDMHGHPLFNLLQDLNEKSDQRVVLFFGPEGGLTEKEQDLLTLHAFEFICLTPTILRSIEAAALGLGVVRSLTTQP